MKGKQEKKDVFVNSKDLESLQIKRAIFSINNTKQIIMMDIFWYVFFIIFILLLWFLFIASEQNIDKTSKEIFLQEISNLRFSSILLILLIIGPFSTFFSIKKHLKQDNNIYFFNDRIEYKNRTIELNKIEFIKTGFYPINGKYVAKILMYSIGFWFVLPLFLFNIMFFYFLKVISLNKVQNISNRFLIKEENVTKPIMGAVYCDHEMINLKKFLENKRIESGRQ